MNTATDAAMDPRNAQNATPAFVRSGMDREPAPTRNAKVAPKEAPEDIPRMYGSASGFWTIACITTPANANEIPTITPISARGV